MGGSLGRSRVGRQVETLEKPFLVLHSLKLKRLLGEVTQRLIPAGARPQPRVHFQRRALRLPENTSYSDLTAFLTAASSPSEVDSFPYLRGLDGNGTGNLNLISDFQVELLGFILYLLVFSMAGSISTEGEKGRRTLAAIQVHLCCEVPPVHLANSVCTAAEVCFSEWVSSSLSAGTSCLKHFL